MAVVPGAGSSSTAADDASGGHDDALSAWFIVRNETSDGRTYLSAHCRFLRDPSPAGATYVSQPLQLNTVYLHGVFEHVVPGLDEPESAVFMYGADSDAARDADEADVYAISRQAQRLHMLTYPGAMRVVRLNVFGLPPPATNGSVYIVPCIDPGCQYFTSYATVKERMPVPEDVVFEEGVYNEDQVSGQWLFADTVPPRSLTFSTGLHAAWAKHMRCKAAGAATAGAATAGAATAGAATAGAATAGAATAGAATAGAATAGAATAGATTADVGAVGARQDSLVGITAVYLASRIDA